MGFVDGLRDVLRSFSGDDYDEYEEAPASRTHNDIYATASTASTAPDYSYYQAPAQPQQPAAQPTAVPDAIVDTIALLRPEKLESVREAADHFLKNQAVILSLKHTDPALARRWLDYLGGMTYYMEGKINRIAPYTYLLTPKGVELVEGFESEQEKSRS
ncbi:MAG: cell division protein SepF [Butyricicoccus sp.]|nr:cell division protein SepF [Butyricicoccus sp.]